MSGDLSPLDPSQFRSPLLEALPPVPPRRDRRVVRRGRWWVLALSALVVVPALTVGLRWLSPDGPGRVLYWLHDTVYLAVKGHLFTRMFPISWIYLLAGLTLLLFALTAVVWARPLTPALQAAMGRRLLYQRWLRPVLRVWASTFKRSARRFRAMARRTGRWPVVGPRCASWAAQLEGPTLLDELVGHERLVALEGLDALDPADDASARALAPAVDLTLFSVQVTTPPLPRSDRDTCRAIEHLGQCLLRLDLVRASRCEDDPSLDELGRQLEAEISSLVRPLLPIRPRKPDFSLPTLAMELALVLELEKPRGWPSELVEKRCERLLEGVDVRRRLLDESRRRLERWAAYAHRHRGRHTVPELQAPRGPIEARLALNVTLFTALRHAAPRGALSFLESLEGLRFALFATSSAEEAESVSTALESLPGPLDYRICAHLLDRDLARTEDLGDALARRSSVFSETDLRLITERQAGLFLAAAEDVRK